MNQVYHNSFYAMATRCHLVLPCMDQSRAERVFDLVKEEVSRVESCLSRFMPQSDISIINQYAGLKPVTVSDEVFQVIKICIDYYRLTDGAFDITLRPLMQLWKNRLPDEGPDPRVHELMKDLGSQQIELNEQDQTVFLKNPKVEIDLGGFGKGYGLETVLLKFREYEVENVFLSFGESSILTLGRHPAGNHWKIGLNDYTNPGQSVYTFNLNEGSVSTSSNFYMDDHGKLQNHRHVISPITGFPVDDLVTVSVRSDSPITAEILSTAFLVLQDNAIESVRAKIPACDIIKINYSTGFPEIKEII